MTEMKNDETWVSFVFLPLIFLIILNLVLFYEKY